MHCLKAKVFIDLLKTFPDAMAIFIMRAQDRRTEFRRVRKMYERWVGFDGNQDMNELPQAVRETLHYEKYTGEKNRAGLLPDLPAHLADPDFYFTNMFKSLKKKLTKKLPEKNFTEDDTLVEDKIERAEEGAKHVEDSKETERDGDDHEKTSMDSFKANQVRLRELTPLKSIP